MSFFLMCSLSSSTGNSSGSGNGGVMQWERVF